MEFATLTRNAVIAELTKSPHGALEAYVPVGTRACAEDPDFFAHLIAWNQRRGAIRDAKVALPVLALAASGQDADHRENSLAHIAMQTPRDLVRAVRFAKGQPAGGSRSALRRTVALYLAHKEEHGFDRAALQHRASLKELYALLHLRPGDRAERILFKGEKLGIFADVARLRDMAPSEAAGTILERRIPFLIARGALGAKMKDPTVLLALIKGMSPTELVTNAKWLERLGVKSDPALRAAFEEALLRNQQGSKQSALKAGVAAEALGEDSVMGDKLRALQEKQVAASLGMVEGNWLILADKSGSMTAAIETARHITAALARAVKGKVHLIFFDGGARYFDATGKTLEELQAETRGVVAGGGTYCGVGLAYAADRSLEVDGIAIISDGGDGTQMWANNYARLCNVLGKQVPVYFYKLSGDPDRLTPQCGPDLQTFDLRSGVDYYSLPNLVQTMRTNRWSLADEIYATPLLRLGDVLPNAVARQGVTP